MTGNLVISIGRECGSGGRLIGNRLAEKLNIKCYDKELLTLAAKKSGLCEEIFESHDEKPTSSFLYSLVKVRFRIFQVRDIPKVLCVLLSLYSRLIF